MMRRTWRDGANDKDSDDLSGMPWRVQYDESTYSYSVKRVAVFYTICRLLYEPTEGIRSHWSMTDPLLSLRLSPVWELSYG